MRIDLFKNTRSHFEVLAHFTKEFQKALRRHKIASKTYDILTQSEGEILAHFVKDSSNYTAGFNVLVAEHSFFEPLNILHLAIIVDCATYYPELINSPHTIALFVDEDSCDFVRFFGHENTIFFPH